MSLDDEIKVLKNKTETDQDDNGYYSYQKLNTNFCLDAGDGGANNQKVVIAEFDIENKNQQWVKEVLASGNIRLKKRDVDFVLNSGSQGVVGQEINLWKSSVNSGNLEWIFTPVHSLGIKSDANIEFSLYPNPAKNELKIEFNGFETAKISILNNLGQTVIYNKLNNRINTIDTSTLSAGMYIVKITNNTQSLTKKLIVK